MSFDSIQEYFKFITNLGLVARVVRLMAFLHTNKVWVKKGIQL